jgi:DNA polymerase-3 subunit delta'
MTFLVGHENEMALLERIVAEGRAAHAYLFSGPEGVGKKLVAIKLACLLNCPDLLADKNASCPVCRRIIAENHPDFAIERPQKGIIRIERIRALGNFFRYAPVEAHYRVIIIDDAHLMNRSAQNALLKTLEEPPPGRILILVTAKPFLLLSTVRSRCRHVRFSPLRLEPLADLLEKQRGIASGKASLLAAMSCGSASKALEMETPNFLELREMVVSALANPRHTGLSGLLEVSAAISADRRTSSEAIEIAVTWLRDLLMQKVLGDASSLIHRDLLDRISSEAQHHSSEALISAYEELAEAAGLIEADINVNRNLVTDLMLLRIARIMTGPSFGLARTAG